MRLRRRSRKPQHMPKGGVKGENGTRQPIGTSDRWDFSRHPHSKLNEKNSPHDDSRSEKDAIVTVYTSFSDQKQGADAFCRHIDALARPKRCSTKIHGEKCVIFCV